MDIFSSIDIVLFDFANQRLACDVFDVVMPALSHVCDVPAVIVLLLVGAATTVRRPRTPGVGCWRRARRFGTVFLYGMAIYAANALAYNVFKSAVGRDRPYLQPNIAVRLPQPIPRHMRANASFPSGHAANAFMLAMLAVRILKVPRIPAFALATAIAGSRVYLGLHFPSDVALGAALGAILTWLLMRRWPPPQVRGPVGWTHRIARRAPIARGDERNQKSGLARRRQACIAAVRTRMHPCV